METDNDCFNDRCAHCSRPAVSRCSRCLLVKYCGRECQRGDWKKHQAICRSDEEIKKDALKGFCTECSSPATQKCANCKKVFYCKRPCQQRNWSVHKQSCYPFEMKRNDELGRHAVATRSIKAGEVILKEEPLLTVPLETSANPCMGCYKPMDSLYRCSKCSWPLCGQKCESSSNHAPECELTSPIKKDIEKLLHTKDIYRMVIVLRALHLKQKDEAKLNKLMELQSTAPAQNKNTKNNDILKDAVKFVRKYMKCNPKLKLKNCDSFVTHVIGALDINGYDVLYSDNIDLVGLYSAGSLFEHSCLPNTKHKFNSSNHLIVKAASDISEGDHISTTYTSIHCGTLERQKDLATNKYFTCHCKRCVDPTEVGSYFSALRCSECQQDGYILPEDPLQPASNWKCSKCQKLMAESEVSTITSGVGCEVEEVLKNPSKEKLENLLKDCISSKVHQNHYHLFKARHTLLQLYGRTADTVKEDVLIKKEAVCQEFLDLCTILDPHTSRLAAYVGVALYEYEDAVMVKVQILANTRYHSQAQVDKGIAFAKALLQRCIKILQDESDDQPGGALRKVAQKKLTEIGLLTSKIL